MDEKQRIILDCQSTWHEDAHKTAVTEADRRGLHGLEREDFIKAREAEVYAKLEGIGQDNIE